MEDTKKEERLNLKLTKEDMARLRDLAAANAGRNNSLMVRELINLAWDRYQDLGLYPPKEQALAVGRPTGASQTVHNPGRG